MSEQTIGDILPRLIKLHGDLSISELARETRIPQPTLHHIIDGKTKKPRRHALETLANFFSVSVSQLTGSIPLGLSIPDAIKDSLKISTVPLIEWYLAKNWIRHKNELSQFDEIILDKQVDENAFALQLKGMSVIPPFHEKSILIFDPTRIPKDRDFALVYLAQQDTIIFNRLYIDGENQYIKQDTKNGNAELIKLNLSCDKMIAALIEARMRF